LASGRTLTGVSGISTRDLGSALLRWAPHGVGVVRVLDKHGFGTAEPGQLLAAGPDGQIEGAVYGGVLDRVALPLARTALTAPRATDAQVAEEPAVAAGLACAGGARLLGHPLTPALADALGGALAQGRATALASAADGSAALVLTGAELGERHGGLGSPVADDAVVEAALGLLRRGATSTRRITEGGLDVLLDLWVPVPEVLVVGAGAIGAALLAQAELLGWSGTEVTELAPARAVIGTFTEADVLVLLDHAPRFDAVLIDGIRRGRGFLGALGSRRTQAARRERLLAAGVSAEELAMLHAPVGLDLAARTPAETAVSIVAEVIAARGGRAGSALAGTDGRIGG
jgi:xanthine dehydrogenase accessory factor